MACGLWRLTGDLGSECEAAHSFKFGHTVQAIECCVQRGSEIEEWQALIEKMGTEPELRRLLPYKSEDVDLLRGSEYHRSA